MLQHHDFSPEEIPFQITNKRLTSMAGVGTLIEAFHNSPLRELFSQSLPPRVSPQSGGSYRMGLIAIASFVRGHDCLADLEEFRRDPFMSELMKGETIAPRTLGDFLRDFETEHRNRLNGVLALQSRSYRLQLAKMLKKQHKPALAPHLYIDSTSHVQHGSKMQGLAYNYKDEWCLDSQVIFDELGFCWDFDLRAGNTKSGVGASEQIKRALSGYSFKDEKYISADSAYCNQDVMKTCIGLGVGFTLTANQATTDWESHIPEITKWEKWQYSQTELQDAAERGIVLEDVELGRFYWQPSWSESLRLPVVVKRRKWRAEEQLSLTSDTQYKYYGVVTNLPLLEWTLQEVIEHHNSRGNAENFIREQKYGYDLKHFPCLQLSANHAYGLLAMVAHNLLRWVSIHDNPSRPRFAKALRRNFIEIPAIIVSHARLLVCRVSQYAYQEVNRLRQALELKLYSPIPGVCSSG